MGFPTGYTELFLPKLFIHVLSLLGFIKSLIFTLFAFLGIPVFHQNDNVFPLTTAIPDHPPLSALFIRDILPVINYQDLKDQPESCAVCLYEFKAGDEIRPLRCRHVFHRSCVDRWMDCEQTTCPLCRMEFVPDDMQDEFHQRLWEASGIGLFCEDENGRIY